MRKILVIFAMGTALCSFSAQAGSPVYKYEADVTTTKGYVGLNWNMEGGMTPAVVLGVLSGKVKGNGDTTGANLAVHIGVADGINVSKVKLGYLSGKNDFQGELGLGYSFLKGAMLVDLGVNAPYVSLAADWINGVGFDPNATIHTLGKLDKPKCVLDNNGAIGVSNCTP
jgi:hypothetical protein